MQKNIQDYIFRGEISKIVTTDDLKSAMKKLPLDNYTAIELLFLKKLSRKGIAAQLGWSVSKVNTKITRGVTLLKRELNPAYFEKMDEILGVQFHF